MSFFPKNPASRVGASQTIAYDSSVGITNAFSVGTYQLRLVANSACHYKIGDGEEGTQKAGVQVNLIHELVHDARHAAGFPCH